MTRAMGLTEASFFFVNNSFMETNFRNNFFEFLGKLTKVIFFKMIVRPKTLLFFYKEKNMLKSAIRPNLGTLLKR